jgi:hypothetical protein
LPPATFSDWRYLTVAAGESLVAFLFGRSLDRLATLIVVLDAAGLSLFAVSGALKGRDFGIGFASTVWPRLRSARKTEGWMARPTRRPVTNAFTRPRTRATWVCSRTSPDRQQR